MSSSLRDRVAAWRRRTDKLDDAGEGGGKGPFGQGEGPEGDGGPGRILVVEDDDAISFGLRTNLTFEGYSVEIANSRAAASDRCRSHRPDLIVLDLMLPDGSGFEVMEDLRAAGYEGLILVLSARKEETDKVGALRIGADDYVTKPFSLAELLARIEALLRRRAHSATRQSASGSAAPLPAGVAGTAAMADTLLGSRDADDSGMRIRFGRCEVDPAARALRVDGVDVSLTRLEFDLLTYLAQNAGRALSRGQLLRDVWGLPHEGSARTVDNVVAHLRTKIGEDAENPRHLLTLRGAGYRFELEPSDAKRAK